MEPRNASSILQLGAIDVITDLPTALTFDDVLLVIPSDGPQADRVRRAMAEERP